VQAVTPGAVLVGLVVTLVGASACVSNGQFVDQPIVWRVDDRKSIAEPEELSFDRYTTLADAFFLRRTTRLLEVKDREAAHNTNALDEVPDSTWFTNRIGVRDVPPHEAALGASADGPPRLPLEVTGGKPGGANPGMMVKDADGRRFVIKFDTKENPGMQTATNNIVNRIFWTLGYNVPNDTIVTLPRDAVFVGAKATIKDEMGRERAMTEADLHATLASAPSYPGGLYRVSASEFIAGTPKGGWSKEGVREDDPNDLIAHEHRRELRGLRVFSAWLNHTDIKQDNTFDSYVEDGGRHYLLHYLLDFGEAFAAQAAEAGRQETGYEHWIDYENQPLAALSFGAWVRPWERLAETRWPSIGVFTAKHFDPEQWRPMSPYWPFDEADASDKYWAAKLVLRFDKTLLTALVSTGELAHPAAERYLVDTLYERGRIIGDAYLGAVTPLDHFSISSHELCAVDLSVAHGLVTSGLVEVLDDRGDSAFDSLVDERGRVCIPLHADDSYRIYRLRVRRRSETRPAMQVHFKGGAEPRILGVVRVER
jgi:hypothetical protein